MIIYLQDIFTSETSVLFLIYLHNTSLEEYFLTYRFNEWIYVDLFAILEHRKEVVLFSNESSLSSHSSIGECHSRFLFMMVPFPILRLSQSSIKWNFWFSNLFTGLPRERCVMCATTHSHMCIQIQVLNSFTILNLITLFYTWTLLYL